MRPASRTSSSPLTSSTPIFRSPTVGRSRSNSTRAMALPITARSTRCLASAPIVAPTSRTIDSPRSVGHKAAIAGRNRDIGLSLLDRVDRPPHGGFPAAMAQGLAGLIVHFYRHIGVDDARDGAQRRPIRQQRFERRPAADHDE